MSAPITLLGFVLVLLLNLLAASASAVDVLTQHNDNQRTGANLNETVLTPANVQAGFGWLYSRSVDGQIYAQPLYVEGVNIPGKGRANVVFVATANNWVYAFEAGALGSPVPFWYKHLGPAVPVRAIIPSPPFNIDPVIGIIATPAIDLDSNTLYVVAKTLKDGLFRQQLHALALETGDEKFGGPVDIKADNFVPRNQLNRPGLLITRGSANNIVWIAFGSHQDQLPWTGWVFAYNARSLLHMAHFKVTDPGQQGGIWQSGQGLAADNEGNVYFMTGNGDFNADQGGHNYGMSFVKLGLRNNGLSVLDWFTPHNWRALGAPNVGDDDLGSGGPLILGNSPALIGGGKEGVLYLLNKDNMGHFRRSSSACPADCQIVQRFRATGLSGCPSTSNATFHIHGAPVYWRSGNTDNIYVWAESDKLLQFQRTGLLGIFFNTTPFAMSKLCDPPGMPGGILSISASSGDQNSGVLWASLPLQGDANSTVVPGVLKAFDAANVSKELWTSEMHPSRDHVGDFAKFVAPTVAKGLVYLATFSNQLKVYGLLPPAPPPPIHLVLSIEPNPTINSQSTSPKISSHVVIHAKNADLQNAPDINGLTVTIDDVQVGTTGSPGFDYTFVLKRFGSGRFRYVVYPKIEVSGPGYFTADLIYNGDDEVWMSYTPNR